MNKEEKMKKRFVLLFTLVLVLLLSNIVSAEIIGKELGEEIDVDYTYEFTEEGEQIVTFPLQEYDTSAGSLSEKTMSGTRSTEFFTYHGWVSWHHQYYGDTHIRGTITVDGIDSNPSTPSGMVCYIRGWMTKNSNNVFTMPSGTLLGAGRASISASDRSAKSGDYYLVNVDTDAYDRFGYLKWQWETTDSEVY